MKNFYFYLIFLIFPAQSILNAQPAASLYFTTGIPMGEFKSFVPSTGFGAATEIFFFSPSEKIPYGIGLNFSYVSYGVHLGVDPYTNEMGLSFNRATNFASVHIMFQVAPYAGSVRPYFETLFGGSYIYSKADVGYDYYFSSLLVDDWAWSYGAGIGLKLLSVGDAFFNPNSVYIDLKVRYLFGTTTSYLDRESIVAYFNTVEYSLIESKTDMITASIGFYFFF